MWIILLEAGLALAILLLIVWWTWPRKHPDGRSEVPGPRPEDKRDE